MLPLVAVSVAVAADSGVADESVMLAATGQKREVVAVGVGAELRDLIHQHAAIVGPQRDRGAGLRGAERRNATRHRSPPTTRTKMSPVVAVSCKLPVPGRQRSGFADEPRLSALEQIVCPAALYRQWASLSSS